jgi:hypothetical protein
MNRKIVFASTLVAAIALALLASLRAAEPAKTPAPAAPEIKLPPGWTAEDMQACIVANTPGKMQEYLTRSAGTWQGKVNMWMNPGADPVKAECKSVVTPIMDGHFIKVEMSGDLPGMGGYNGLAFFGYDNAAKQFVTTCFDNQGTGILPGTGQLSADGKVMTWTYTFTCPLNGKPTAMRQVETTTGSKTKTMEIFTAEPKSGKEFKMMFIELTKE